MADQSKYTHKLQGCHVLIIGGTSGVGFAVAEACIEHGAKTVIVSSSNTSNISATIKRLKTAYPEATAARTSVHGFPCDLANADNIEDNVSRLFSDCMTVLPDNAKLDHVVFTAGNTIPQTQLADTTLATIQTFAQVRFFGALLVAKHARAHISPSPKSSLTLSAGSGKPVKGWLTGHSLSAGLQGMTEALACELAPIRVNIVSMGAVATELWVSVQRYI